MTPGTSASIAGAGVCPDGFLCAQPGHAPRPCNARRFCKNNQEAYCEPGTYNPYRGRAACLACPIGAFCPEEGLYHPKPCPRQYVCNRRGLVRPAMACLGGLICEGGQKNFMKNPACYTIEAS